MSVKRRKQKVEADLRTIIVRVLFMSGIGTAVFFVLTALASFVCLKNDSSPEAYGYFDLAIGTAAGFVCGFFATRPVKKKGLIIGTVSTMPMYLVVSCISILVSHGGLGLTGWLLGAVMLIAGAIGGIVAVN